MATYVLVHGGGRGGWCWRDVTPVLRAHGHDVYAPTLTGLGERSHLIGPDIDLDTHIADIAAVLHYEDLRDVILAGHSYGGMVITGVAALAPERVRELVYLDAAMPQHGEALYQLVPQAFAELVETRDGIEFVIWPEDDDYGLSDPEDIAWMQARMAPHPWKSMLQPLRLTNEAAVARIPRTSVICSNPGLDGWPRGDRPFRADRVWEIDTSHDLMMTKPQDVAEMLLRLADRARETAPRSG
jgi:pimeloyl-ACP methyl ester carboxylesterase